MLIFEKTVDSYTNDCLPSLDVPYVLPTAALLRERDADLPEIPECEIDRHYSELERRAHGVNNGFYPLGSCTMKYNPKINEEIANFAGFSDIHPLQPLATVQGALNLMSELARALCEISGMDAMSLEPSAGAQGEFAGVAIIKAYHNSRGDINRTKLIVPDSAHGTNPASAAMNGYTVITVPSKEGLVDVDALERVIGGDTAGLMLTNPNTLGLFDENILKITELIHSVGGLCYYDGANMNALMGIARPGDMGFDVIHLNLHKTFSTPHGGGGPGSGAVGVKRFLRAYLPTPIIEDGTLKGASLSIGKVRSFYGNFLVCVKAYCYILSLGAEGIRCAAEVAVLNANYLMRRIGSGLTPYERICMHEFVLSLSGLKKQTGVSALDIAKGLIDAGMHPPTMYFPLIVEEALMFEPTETEAKRTLDEAADKFLALIELAREEPSKLHDAPTSTPISRPDEVRAARSPIISR